MMRQMGQMLGGVSASAADESDRQGGGGGGSGGGSGGGGDGLVFLDSSSDSDGDGDGDGDGRDQGFPFPARIATTNIGDTTDDGRHGGGSAEPSIADVMKIVEGQARELEAMRRKCRETEDKAAGLRRTVIGLEDRVRSLESASKGQGGQGV